MTRGKLIVFSAPSGAGKSTLKDQLMVRFPALGYSISATTRKPRVGEHEGVHYFFKTPEQFRSMIEHGELVEYNEVHGNFYGTPRQAVDQALAEGRSLIFDLDVYGKANFDKIYPEAIGIFIVPPSLGELEKRLRMRGTEDDETLKLRLLNATAELEFGRTRGKYEYTVVNDDLGIALIDLTGILKKELR